MSLVKLFGISADSFGQRTPEARVHLEYTLRIGIIMASVFGMIMLTFGTNPALIFQCAVIGGLSIIVFWKMPVVTDTLPANTFAGPTAIAPARPAASHTQYARQTRPPTVDHDVSPVGGGGRVPTPPSTTVDQAKKASIAARYKNDMAQRKLIGATADRKRAAAILAELTQSFGSSGEDKNSVSFEELETAQMVLSVAEFELNQAALDADKADTEYTSAVDAEYAITLAAVPAAAPGVPGASAAAPVFRPAYRSAIPANPSDASKAAFFAAAKRRSLYRC